MRPGILAILVIFSLALALANARTLDAKFSAPLADQTDNSQIVIDDSDEIDEDDETDDGYRKRRQANYGDDDADDGDDIDDDDDDSDNDDKSYVQNDFPALAADNFNYEQEKFDLFDHHRSKVGEVRLTSPHTLVFYMNKGLLATCERANNIEPGFENRSWELEKTYDKNRSVNLTAFFGEKNTIILKWNDGEIFTCDDWFKFNPNKDIDSVMKEKKNLSENLMNTLA